MQFGEAEMKQIFSSNHWAYKRAEDFSIICSKMFLEYLPTGFDKSLIFQLLPWVLTEMWNFECSTVVMLSRHWC